MGKKRKKVTPKFFDEKKMTCIKQSFPKNVVDELRDAWSDRRKDTIVYIGSLYKFSANYHVRTSILYTPSELIRYIDNTEENFFEIRITRKGKPEFKFRFKTFIKFTHKRWILEVLNSVLRHCQDSRTRSELKWRIKRIKNSQVVPVVPTEE